MSSSTVKSSTTEKRPWLEDSHRSSSSSSSSSSSTDVEMMETLRKRCKLSSQDVGDKSKSTVDNDNGQLQTNDNVPTLLDLSAKITSEHVCFQEIEERYSLIPEPVQKRLLFWAFPNDEKRIRLYSCRASSSSSPPSSSSSTNSQSSQTSATDLIGVISSSVHSVKATSDNSDYSAFSEGVRHLDNDCVQDALQIGKKKK